MANQQLLSQRLGEVAFISKEFSEQAPGELGNRPPVIDITGCEAEGEQLAHIIDDQVQLEAVEPTYGGFASCSSSGKDTVLVNARIATDGKGSGVDEADARTAAQARVQIGDQGNQDRGHQLDKPLIAHQRRELGSASETGHTPCNRP